MIKQELELAFYETNALHFENGIPILDLSRLFSTNLGKNIIDNFIKIIKEEKIVGLNISPNGLSLASMVAVSLKLPFVYLSKENNDLILKGNYAKDEEVILVDDFSDTGSSIVKSLEELERHDLQCTNVYVLFDMEKGVEEKLKYSNVKLHYLTTFPQILETLKDHDRLDKQTFLSSLEYVRGNKL